MFERWKRKRRPPEAFNCGEQDKWGERALTAAGLLRDNRSTWEAVAGRPVSIADFGAGNERLRPILAETLAIEQTYHPFDLHPQQSTTTRLDVTAGLPDRDFDIGICLGLLEYLPSIRALADSLHEHCRFVLASYVISDGPVAIDREAREASQWITHATEAELLADFAAAGFSPIASTRSDNEGTAIWLWSR
jgi:hypothetical protein